MKVILFCIYRNMSIIKSFPYVLYRKVKTRSHREIVISIIVR